MTNITPTPDGHVADAVKGNWVDNIAPMASRPFLRLSRADRPIGTWLLLLPCWWGLSLAMIYDQTVTWHDAWIAVSCAIGAWLMRGAGCTWNDISDRHYDGQVERTRSRPIPSGQISVPKAVIWMCIQAFIAFSILLTYHVNAIFLGIMALVPVAIYPFAKRFTWWPQVFLGLAFNWGALLAWTAHTGSLIAPAIALYMAGIAWTLFYDTIYANQDTEDDALIGVKSTARLFGTNTTPWLWRFLIATILLMAISTTLTALPQASTLALLLVLAGSCFMGWHMARQLHRLDINDPKICLLLFRENRTTGMIPLVFFCIALLV